ncbi:hypothetical protein Cadr_000005207 [Camelus dromedarius]|uniref:Uncharacterized protein n=1 Tax=Camelus dromedarius TaxID=9838 RepID=A0A5N4E1T7_CAMDR|nr:hypothetical protein Cadr_000005207 [Camelus dromedarius]
MVLEGLKLEAENKHLTDSTGTLRGAMPWTRIRIWVGFSGSSASTSGGRRGRAGRGRKRGMLGWILSCSGKESAERVGKGIKCAVERWLSKLEPTSESPAGPRPRFLVGGLGRWGSPSPDPLTEEVMLELSYWDKTGQVGGELGLEEQMDTQLRLVMEGSVEGLPGGQAGMGGVAGGVDWGRGVAVPSRVVTGAGMIHKELHYTRLGGRGEAASCESGSGPDGEGHVAHVNCLRVCAVDWGVPRRSGGSLRAGWMGAPRRSGGSLRAGWMVHLWESRLGAMQVVVQAPEDAGYRVMSVEEPDQWAVGSVAVLDDGDFVAATKERGRWFNKAAMNSRFTLSLRHLSWQAVGYEEECQEYTQWSGDTSTGGGGGGVGPRRRGDCVRGPGRSPMSRPFQREGVGDKEKECIQLPWTWRLRRGGRETPDEHGGRWRMTESGARSRGSRLTGSWKLKLWRSRHRLGWRHGFESHALRSRLDKTLGEDHRLGGAASVKCASVLQAGCWRGAPARFRESGGIQSFAQGTMLADDADEPQMLVTTRRQRRRDWRSAEIPLPARPGGSAIPEGPPGTARGPGGAWHFLGPRAFGLGHTFLRSPQDLLKSPHPDTAARMRASFCHSSFAMKSLLEGHLRGERRREDTEVEVISVLRSVLPTQAHTRATPHRPAQVGEGFREEGAPSLRQVLIAGKGEGLGSVDPAEGPPSDSELPVSHAAMALDAEPRSHRALQRHSELAVPPPLPSCCRGSRTKPAPALATSHPLGKQARAGCSALPLPPKGSGGWPGGSSGPADPHGASERAAWG